MLTTVNQMNYRKLVAGAVSKDTLQWRYFHFRIKIRYCTLVLYTCGHLRVA